MGRKLNVNWTELYDLGKRTKTNVEELETIRQNMLNLVASLANCWQGGDSNNYCSNLSNYLKDLKNDVEYIDEWAKAFDRSASLYHNSVDQCANYVRNTRVSFEQENIREE